MSRQLVKLKQAGLAISTTVAMIYRRSVRIPPLGTILLTANYGLAEEAEVYRRDLERSLARLADRINRNELIYHQIRYVDDQGREIAKVVDGAIDQNREDLSNSQIFQATRKLPPGEMYRSPIGPLMTFAIPVYET